MHGSPSIATDASPRTRATDATLRCGDVQRRDASRTSRAGRRGRFGKRVGGAERAHRDVARRPWTDAAYRLECVDRYARCRRPDGGQCRHRPPHARDPAACAPAMSSSDRPQLSQRCVATFSRTGTTTKDRRRHCRPERRSERAASRPSSVRAPATLTCWPTIARTASSKPSHVRVLAQSRSRFASAPSVARSVPDRDRRRTRAATRQHVRVTSASDNETPTHNACRRGA